MIRDVVIWLHARAAAVFCAIAAAATVLVGGGLSRSQIELVLDGVEVPGTVVRLVEKQVEPGPPSDPAPEAGPDADDEEQKPAACAPMLAPEIGYRDLTGAEATFTSTSYSCPPRYGVGDTVTMLIDPDAQSRVMIKPRTFLGIIWLPTVIVLVTALLAWLAWRIRPSPEQLAKAFEDPAGTDEISMRIADRTAVPGGSPLSGIVASAAQIAEGRYPLDLCELTAYMAALAYHETDDKDAIARYVEKNCPHFTHVRSFGNEDTEGFGFVVDGAAFIVMRGTMGIADWRRNLRAAKTKPADLLPADVDWQAPPRHLGFAEGWHVIRDQVEAWIRTTPYKSDPGFPFVFTGHSLGGALSFLGAWEFAKRGRNVAAVITFGAARPGDAAFAKEYDELGLGKRTLRLEFTQDIVPEVQKLLGYEAVGNAWEPQRLPLLSQRLAIASVLVNGIVGSLQSSLFGSKDEEDAKKKEEEREDAAKTKKAANAAASSSAPAAAVKSARQRIAEWMFRLVLFLAFSSILALAAHKIERRYAMALSIMSYRRIRARHMRTAGSTTLSIAQLDACYAELERHLMAMRGSTPANPGVFTGVPNLPRRIVDPRDLRWLNTFLPARSW